METGKLPGVDYGAVAYGFIYNLIHFIFNHIQILKVTTCDLHDVLNQQYSDKYTFLMFETIYKLHDHLNHPNLHSIYLFVIEKSSVCQTEVTGTHFFHSGNLVFIFHCVSTLINSRFFQSGNPKYPKNLIFLTLFAPKFGCLGFQKN